MMTANITAAMLLIGNELLSGRTRDANLSFVGSRLTAYGVRLAEARFVRDEQMAIVEAVNALRSRYDYVFTCGGIGPTHDDITADCVARAFGVTIAEHAEARRRLMAFWAERDMEANPARLRMARVPEGATLIDNDISVAPGFRLHNVFVMAGVPSIMQNMFEHVLPTLEHGLPLQSVSIVCPLGEGTVAAPLAELQRQFSDVEIGSYPGDAAARGAGAHVDLPAARTADGDPFEVQPDGDSGGPSVVLVARSVDQTRLDEARKALEALVQQLTGRAERSV